MATRRLTVTDDGYVLLAKYGPGVSHWCGYLGLPAGHAWRSSVDGYDTGADVHGGITYWQRDGELPINGAEALSLSTAGVDIGVWAGFDCAHAGDATEYSPDGRRWTLDDVWQEIESLLTQAREAGGT